MVAERHNEATSLKMESNTDTLIVSSSNALPLAAAITLLMVAERHKEATSLEMESNADPPIVSSGMDMVHNTGESEPCLEKGGPGSKKVQVSKSSSNARPRHYTLAFLRQTIGGDTIVRRAEVVSTIWILTLILS